MQSLSDGLLRQIKDIEIIPDKPLLITDADEVLLNFVLVSKNICLKKIFGMTCLPTLCLEILKITQIML